MYIPKNVLIIKATRCVDALIKSDEDNDFYLDVKTGAFLYVDLHADEDSMKHLESFIEKEDNKTLFLLPKMTEYGKKKIIEEFVHDKVSDLEVSEKLINEIATLGYETRLMEVFREYPTEHDKWNLFFSEKMRSLAVVWLNEIIEKVFSVIDLRYVFEEDVSKFLDYEEIVLFKENPEVNTKDIKNIKSRLLEFSKIYKQPEIINPKPKRGRPPKGKKIGVVENVIIPDMYITYDSVIRSFVYYDSELSDILPNPLDFGKELYVQTPERALCQSISGAKVEF